MKKILVPVLLLVSVLFISVVSAGSTFVMGTIYGKTYGGDKLTGVDISINCGGDAWTGNSVGDGSYAASLDSGVCKDGASMKVSLSKSGYTSRTFSGTYDSSDLDSIGVIDLGDGNNFLVVNFVLSEKGANSVNNNGRSSGGGCRATLWDCSPEWSNCVDGSQTRTCHSNCGTTREEEQSCTVINPSNEQSLFVPENKEPGFFSTITGAVTGTLGSTKGLIGVGIVVLAIVLGLVYIAVRKKK